VPSGQSTRSVSCCIGNSQLFRRSAIPKVHCADTCHSANVWVKVKVRVRIRIRIRVKLRVSLGVRLRVM